MIVLRSDFDISSVEAWKVRLEELKTLPVSDGVEMPIYEAETMISLFESDTPKKSPAEAA